MLGHSLRQGIAEPMEGESLALTLVQRALGPRTTRAAGGASAGRQRLADRVKLILASDLARRLDARRRDRRREARRLSLST